MDGGRKFSKTSVLRKKTFSRKTTSTTVKHRLKKEIIFLRKWDISVKGILVPTSDYGLFLESLLDSLSFPGTRVRTLLHTSSYEFYHNLMIMNIIFSAIICDSDMKKSEFYYCLRLTSIKKK